MPVALFTGRNAAIAGALLAAACAIFLFAARAVPAAAPAGLRSAELDRMEAACVQAMVRNTCQVMTTAAPLPGQTIFVAGLGPVDGAVYRQLRASGEAMCRTVRSACAHEA